MKGVATSVSLILLYFGIACAYIALAFVAAAGGVAAPWLVVGALAACLALPCFVAMLSFALAWIFRTPRPPAFTIGPIASLRMFIGEAMAIARSHPRMAFGWWVMRDPPPAPAAAPVLLLHGVLCNAGIWRGTIPRLAAAGSGPLYTLSYGPPTASIELFAEQLDAKVEAICKDTGAARVALVTHSMGGLVARAYLRRFGGVRVRCLVTVGAPHHGSVDAWMFPGECLAQMRPGNAWLAALNAEARPPATRIVSLWSRHDSMVAPQASAELAGADNIAFIGIGHNALVEHPDVIARVAAELSRA
jgi:pimeloyl-ACP methyl ester carboxylesterase